MDNQKSESLKDILPFQYQVAGHRSKNSFGGILKHKDGCLLKPVNKLPQGAVEVSFYEKLKYDEDLAPLKKFIPEYFGCLFLNINGMDIKFLKLRDVTEHYLKPCVMDVKIGKQTWEPNATLEKRKTEDMKYALSKKEFGFCIPGFNVYDISTQSILKFGKEEGKTLGNESTKEAFKKFFNCASGFSSVILQNIIQQLNEVLNWWDSQTYFHVYSSSILLVYDAEKLNELIANKLKLFELIKNNFWVKIYMIDFAHVVYDNDSKDLNYISGLSNLITVLKGLM